MRPTLDTSAAGLAPSVALPAAGVHVASLPTPTPAGSRNIGENDVTWFIVLTTYLSFGVLIFFGHMRDLFGKVTGISRYFSGKRRTPKVRR